MLKAVIAVVVATCSPLFGTTLQQLTLDQMIQKSTTVVRGKAQQTTAAPHGAVIYTHYRIQVTEQWKGAPVSPIDVSVPGGWANGTRQTYSGAPTFLDGQDYVFFLWTSRTGLTQVIGLSQGLFIVTADSTGQLMVTRGAATEPMLDGTGKPVTDSEFTMPYAEFKAKVLAGKGNQ
jgi:hypothetical protein